MALAEGGFQVGELAKLYFPGGKEINSLDYTESLRQTNELLRQEQVIIYEAAIQIENYFIRADILRKNGDHLELIEVKAKSIDTAQENDFFLNKSGYIDSGWKPYLYDIAFQKYVLKKAFPKYSVNAFLMLADKNAACPTDGLNQKFKIIHDKNGRKKVQTSTNISEADLSAKILCKLNVDDHCEQIYSGADSKDVPAVSYADQLKIFADNYAQDKKIISCPSSDCAKCEFQTTPAEKAQGLKSGFEECWKETLGWQEKDFAEPTVLDIWNFKNKDKCFEQGLIKIKDISEEQIAPKTDQKLGLSQSERQWLQVKKLKSNDRSIWLDRDGLQSTFEKFVYPLHFIDFETTMVAIPFNKGRKPYEGIAFQFSHHIVYEDGRIEHKGQFLNAEPGVFPNYNFLRALKNGLEQDNGNIFRYATHENTFLNHIYRQLIEDPYDIPDKTELLEFIKSITQSTGGSIEKWQGKRNMIDLCHLVKRFYYDPFTNGSNSIKKVLPAILNSSDFLKTKYSKPIYGAAGGIPSFNFKDWQWLKLDNGKVIDPYKQLPKMFQGCQDIDVQLFSDNPELCDGGAALTAYAKLQFEEMSEYERQELKSALLKYCELDTLAMVMIYESWEDLIKY